MVRRDTPPRSASSPMANRGSLIEAHNVTVTVTLSTVLFIAYRGISICSFPPCTGICVIVEHMRTTLILPDELVDQARSALGFTSKTDTVVYALREVVRRSRAD